MARRLPPVIAIDGPSASGKGTVAQLVARDLGFHYLDSGALYRLVALAALEAGLNLDDGLRVSDIALNINTKFNGETVRIGSRDVTDAIRAESISGAASQVAALPGVRDALITRQRAFRRPPGLVADGRDMGSVVFPDATLKIFLTASPEERANRRHKQLMEKGIDASINTLLQDILDRDTRDTTRAAAPLQKSVDAVEIDTTGMTIAAVVAQVLAQCRHALRAP
ncbi:MAG: cytidylate kinase [Betaproteobacteria bacterium RIFCSPLOWO2_12_FULL_62_58]|nr:MAG: cytidylate kinase [Betaproteobacteria bacterium RIFCSPLOWO2_12_FULL_62_58]